MLVKTGTPTEPPAPKVEGTLSRLDPPERGGYPTGFILTGWSDGVVDSNVLAPTAKLTVVAPRFREMTPFQKRLARIVRFDPERRSKREIAEFLDKINRKTREAREQGRR